MAKSLVGKVLLALAVLGLAACTAQTAAPAGNAPVPHLDALVKAVESGSNEQVTSLVQYTSLPCSYASGMGGPPKCQNGEEDGTLVEVLPVLGPEGHHIRRSEIGGWRGIGAAQFYAAYRVGESTYRDEFFPAGDYGIAFLSPDRGWVNVFQVTEGGIVRLDFYARQTFDEMLKASEVLVLAEQMGE